MAAEQSALAALAELDRVLKHHPDAEVRNLTRLRDILHPHTAALCRVLSALVRAFPGRKLLFLVEAELSQLGWRARPEDVVAWIEGVGVLVVEVKSHAIDGIRSFENNVPQVVYQGRQAADTDLLEQPRDFAYKLKAQLEKLFDDAGQDLPPVYYAGWLPNVSPLDVVSRHAEVAPDRVWLCDVLERDALLGRLPLMKNLTRGANTDRPALELFSSVFGVTSGLRQSTLRRPVRAATMGHAIDQRNGQLKVLTKEQEDLAFSPHLTRGPKVIRGVAGSGKTVVLANAVAEAFLRHLARAAEPSLFVDGAPAQAPDILVLCFNRSLVSYLRDLIGRCFEARKPYAGWKLPWKQLTIKNIDQYAGSLAHQAHTSYDRESTEKTVAALLGKGVPDRERFDHVFIDEGQDILPDWYPLVRAVVKASDEEGPSIVVFFDEAQNLYAVKRPGTGGTPPWKTLLGVVPNARGLRTIMRVGHRNTNEILSFSFNLLLGAFADADPEMATFAELASYQAETIPDDPGLNHPNAGKPCVERLGDRQHRVNFAVQRGPRPNVHVVGSVPQLLKELVKELQRITDPAGCDVDLSDVLVMAPTHAAVEAILMACGDAGIPTHCPVLLPGMRGEGKDPRNEPFFQQRKVTVSTIRSAKGYTAHVCQVAFVHELAGAERGKEANQRSRAELHVACTRATLFLDLWGTACPLVTEAQLASEALA